MDRRVQAVIAFMGAHLQADLPLKEMARSVNLSSSRFRHLFKAETGSTPAQYLKSLRMRGARELIEMTFLTMKEVMSVVGVRDKRHFTEDFKRAYGLTPSQHRARHLTAAPLIEVGGRQ